MNETHALIIALLCLAALPFFYVLGHTAGRLNSGNWKYRCQQAQAQLSTTTHEAGELLLERDAYRKAYLEERTTCQLALAAVAELQEEIDLHMKAEATTQEFLSGSD